MSKTTTTPFDKTLKDSVFFGNQGVFVNAVVTNQVAWGILADKVTELVAARAVYEPLYTKILDLNTRTRADIAAHRLGRETYEKKCRLFWNQWIEDNADIPAEEKLLTGGRLKDAEPSLHPDIAESPFGKARTLGGSDVEFKFRSDRDKTLPSLHKDANMVEVRYVALEVGDIPPGEHDDYPKKELSSRPKFILTLGGKNIGKRCFFIARWVNTRKPKQEGPWSDPQSVVIS
jgi:hypothetical protein